MPFRNDGEGLHRAVDPADGKHYVYGMSFMDAAPTIFACFDQPDLKAPYTFHVRAPRDWTVIGNAPGEQVEPGVWELEQSQPLSTYFVTLVAGPYHVIRDEHDGIPLGLSARASIAARPRQGRRRAVHDHPAELRRDAPAVRDPLPVRRLPPGVRAGVQRRRDGEPGLRHLPRPARLHQPGHPRHAGPAGHDRHPRDGAPVVRQPRHAGVVGRPVAQRVVRRVHGQPGRAPTSPSTPTRGSRTPTTGASGGWSPTSGPSTHPVAGNGAVDASAALQDFDGISYAKGCAVLRQVAATLGDEVFFAGVRDHFEQHRFGNATMHDLFGELGARGRRGPVARSPTAGCAPPAPTGSCSTGPPASYAGRRPPSTPRTGRTGSAPRSPAPDGTWSDVVLEVDSPETPFDAGDAPVLLDPYNDTWALLDPRQADDGRAGDAAASGHRPAAARRASGPTCAARCTRPSVDPVDVLDLVAGEPAGRGHRGLAAPDDRVGLRLGAAAAAGPGRRDRAGARRRARQARPPPRRPPRSSWRRSAASLATCPSSGPLTELAGRRRPAGRRTSGRRPALALPRAGSPPSARSRSTSSTASSPPSRPPSRGSQHARARASLPTAEAKAWAWSCFTGEVDLPNYELEAVGLGFWRGGQESRHRAVRRALLRRAARDRRGAQRLGAGRRRRAVLPAHLALARRPSRRARRCIADPDLDLSIRRRLVDEADTLRRKLAVLAAYPRP